MTCREKLKKEHPDKVDDNHTGCCEGCPDDYGYLEPPKGDGNIVCDGSFKNCTLCWDREIPEETQEKAVARVVEAFDDAMGRPSSTIKDSGDRT